MSCFWSLYTLYKLNWTKQTPGKMRWNWWWNIPQNRFEPATQWSEVQHALWTTAPVCLINNFYTYQWRDSTRTTVKLGYIEVQGTWVNTSIYKKFDITEVCLWMFISWVSQMSDNRVSLSQYTKNKVYGFHFIFWFIA